MRAVADRRYFLLLMGGLIALALTESMTSYYNGGVAFSGLLSAPQPFLKRAAFDLLVLYRHYFHGILPSPAHVGFSYAPDQQTLDSVTASLASNEAAAAPLRAYSGARNNQDLSELLVFHTDALRDLQQRCGGNPFDNRQTLYTLGSESAVVNAGVERYSAESAAQACASAA